MFLPAARADEHDICLLSWVALGFKIMPRVPMGAVVCVLDHFREMGRVVPVPPSFLFVYLRP